MENKKSELMEWVKDILVALILALLILYFFKPIIIKKSSMENSFYENDFIVISKQSYTLFSDIERGDVIVFESSMQDEDGSGNRLLIKRVIALPGETIEIKDGYVYINDELLDEPYLKEQGKSGYLAKTEINEGEIFVMGDNREVSYDSRSLGSIGENTVLGRVVLRILPVKSFKLIKRIEY